MSYSNTVTQEDLKNILNEVLPPASEGYATVSNSVTQSTASGQKTFVIPIMIPDGYAFLSINRVATSYAECLINGFGWNGASNSVEVSIRNTYNGTLNCKVDVEVVCYKLNGILPSKAVDYIVEQGTSGIWTHRKWNSGIAECWGRHSFTVTAWAQWGVVGNQIKHTLLIQHRYSTHNRNLVVSTYVVPMALR